MEFKMKREFISELKLNEQTKIGGFIETIRDTRYMVFVVLKDITGKIQISIDKNSQSELAEKVLKVIPHSVLTVVGIAKKNDFV
jgi:aspartyl-tRNA synthetase